MKRGLRRVGEKREARRSKSWQIRRGREASVGIQGGKRRGKGVAKIGREEEKGGVFRGERVARREEEKGREGEERKRRGGDWKRRGERDGEGRARQGRGHGKERQR